MALRRRCTKLCGRRLLQKLPNAFCLQLLLELIKPVVKRVPYSADSIPQVRQLCEGSAEVVPVIYVTNARKRYSTVQKKRKEKKITFYAVVSAAPWKS